MTSTRSSLSNSESTLLEKESRLAYIETVNQQLQTRLQKMMDRESSTETYLHDLEVKLHGHTSGEEKNAAIINELKKELARIRENEAGCEDYISTLEERLAESEQDMELMQREIDRLEHVVDRQRSLGKLDNLLLELDSIKERENGTTVNGESLADKSEAPSSPSSSKPSSLKSVDGGAQDEGSLGGVRSPTPHGTPPIKESPAEEEYVPESYRTNGTDEYKHMPQSPAQTQFVADKLETVQQELCDLKVEHEQTLGEYEQMNANYEAALRSVAALQDQIDELRHAKPVVPESTSRGTSPPESPVQRPTSFLADARVSDLKVSEGQPSSSRSLSSELSLAGELPSPMDLDKDGLRICLETETEREVSRASTASPDGLLKKVEILLKEKEEIERAAEEEQKRLQRQLNRTRDELSELKSFHGFNSGGRSSPPSQFLRRKSSQSLVAVDRAQRAFTNLRRIAMEHFAEAPEVLENFELNLDGAIRELQTRSERIQELELEVSALRKDMESKTAMIAGLTRERTSIQSSPMDISVVAVMQCRIDETEARLHKTRLALTEREGELASAKKSLEVFSGESQSEAITLLDELTKERKLTAQQATKIHALQQEVEQIKSGQEHVLHTLQQSKRDLETALEDVEADLARTRENALQHEKNIRHTFDRQVNDYQDRIDALQNTILDNKQTIGSQLARVAELEEAHAEAQRQLESQLASESSSDEEVKKHQAIVADLERTISQNKELIHSQQTRLDTLEQSYDDVTKELATLKEEKAAALAALRDAEERAIEEATATAAVHDELLAAVRAELADSQEVVLAQVQSLAKVQAAYDNLQQESMHSAEGSTESKEELERQLAEHGETIAEHQATIARYEAAIAEHEATIAKHEATVAEHEAAIAEHEATIAKHDETIASHVAGSRDLQDILDQREFELQRLKEKEKKHAKLVEDLEQELTFTFDQNQESANTLAILTKDFQKAKQEREALAATAEQKAAESQKVIESLNEEIIKLRVLLFILTFCRWAWLLISGNRQSCRKSSSIFRA